MTFKEFMHTPNAYLDELARKAEDQRTADEAYAKLIARYPKGNGVYADAIIDLIGVKAMDLLIKYRKIEMAGVLEGRKVYAI